MSDINPEFIEKYQLMLADDPASKVFAPLAEAYRKIGLLDEALEICERGVRYNPQFPGGRVALAKAYIDKGQHREAVAHLRKAAELSPENILAHSLLADSLVQLKHPKEALKAYKMVLFLNPEHAKAQRAVRKLESLTADEYEEDVFAMKPLSQVSLASPKKEESPIELRPIPETEEEKKRSQVLERYLSLADAFIVRNDTERAAEVLNEAEAQYGPHPHIQKRLRLVNHNQVEEDLPDPEPLPEISHVQEDMVKAQKIEYLQSLLQRISSRDRTR